MGVGRASMQGETGTRTATAAVLRGVLCLDAFVFLAAALLNAGVIIPLGSTQLSFPVPIWQAGVGEAVIGLALLAAGVAGNTTGAWVAFWLSVAGIAFGLSSPRVQGPARDIHLLLVPLAVIVFALLMWQREQRRRLRDGSAGEGTQVTVTARQDARAQGQPVAAVICGLMVVATVAFAVASLVHFGVAFSLGPVRIGDPFQGATIPEAVIAVALGVGSAAAIARWSSAWPLALATTLFALGLTLYGLTVTLASSRTGDIEYHIAVVVVLVVIVALLLHPTGRRSLTGSPQAGAV